MRNLSKPIAALSKSPATSSTDRLVEFFLKLDKISYTAEANLQLKVCTVFRARPTVIQRNP